MLPAHLAENIRKQILFYLQSTFSFRNADVEWAFMRFLEDPESGIFKGPWVSMKRPFRPAPDGVSIPFDINVPFHPFVHQYRSWLRLSAKAKAPESTIITTGTGSGKTECFLFPILDHCLRMRREGQKGIKAIVLYPMNALASDQEKRFAKAIWSSTELKKAGIRVGNYTGRYDASGKKAGGRGTKEMGREHGISHHDVQQETPPDILLTNYRMLDFLLMRPSDQNLWRFNNKGVLRYLVLDELHTYDGAQGADVACLIRRLKERLDIAKGELCVVGTSATLESRERFDATLPGAIDSMATGEDRLAEFASTLFEEDIPQDAVIGEARLDVEDIVREIHNDYRVPTPAECVPLQDEDALRYAVRQAGHWGAPGLEIVPGDVEDSAVQEWGVALGQWLKGLKLFRDLLLMFKRFEEEKRRSVTFRDIVEEARSSEPGMRALDHDGASILCASFLALIDNAKERHSAVTLPLVPTQVQIWIRELRRIGRVVGNDARPVFMWLDEPVPRKKSLPAFHCSECGESGWIALHDPSKDSLIGSRGVRGMKLNDDPTQIYRAWFGDTDDASFKGARIVIFSPWEQGAAFSESDNDFIDELPTEHWHVHPQSIVLRRGKGNCPLSGEGVSFRVRMNNDTRVIEDTGKEVGDQSCPACGSKTGVFFIGTQAATMASVAIDEMFGSLLNNDPKLLAFTDSVQDASHRAAFFTARTYRFTFRTALQHVIDAAGENGLPLEDVGERTLSFWSEKSPGRFGSVKETMATLMPFDLQQYTGYREFRDSRGSDAAPNFLHSEIASRLTWEAVSEFGYMKTHGRTIEVNGCAALGFDPVTIDALVQHLRDRLERLDPSLVAIHDISLKRWIAGMLMRYRERGALYHPYLDQLARNRFWGKNPFGRTVPGRETYPPMGHYRPRLIVTKRDRDHECLLTPSAGGSSAPWHIVWTRRTLGKAIEEAVILDLLRQFLKSGAETGLLRLLHKEDERELYALNDTKARLYSDTCHFICSRSRHSLVCPSHERDLWEGAPSMDYYSHDGVYVPAEFYPRQLYYQDRYRKGSVRRVVAGEHTGLLNTGEREELEKSFTQAQHLDDPNVLTCTSTLEMGIDIGDLSSTMLCSIPPSTASYLQRIGRAGRATGTALIISIVNQRPHDLFFYSRPNELLKGKIDPPGCWLDASAVLVRQYVGYCFDCAVKKGIISDLPGNCTALIADMNNSNGMLPTLIQWVSKNEEALRAAFIERFRHRVLPDTLERFTRETATDLINQRLGKIASDYDKMIRENNLAIQRLQNDLNQLGPSDEDERQEIEQELRVLKARKNTFERTSTLEVLTDNGLIPNYAFPERGVRFFGALYNTYRENKAELAPVELSRPAGQAIRELAPYNLFYTHNRQFEIQQLYTGSQSESLVKTWAICGKCGHMSINDVNVSAPADQLMACPQCGHSEGPQSRNDSGQQREFIEFAESQAISFMENYESLSGDRHDERQRNHYQIIRSFDQTINAPSGAVGDDQSHFGIEYRSALIMREINTGYYGHEGVVPFGPGATVSDVGYRICRNCGIVVPKSGILKGENHRKSCQGRKRYIKLKQEEKAGDPFEWYNAYLYRELKSEAIRLLLPFVDDELFDTLIACLYLGLRLRFQGNPANLIISSQVLPDQQSAMEEKHYLVLMDAVPGGTGYLKTLFQEKDANEMEGFGIVDIMKRALNALEMCACRNLNNTDYDDPDGCYRCIRTYHLQYNAERISRDRGIELLRSLISAAEKRVRIQALDDIKPDALYESILERRFIAKLESYVKSKKGRWNKTIIKGNRGFMFSLSGSPVIWEIEMQPVLGKPQGVSVQCRPDFILRPDASDVRPIAVFTDGFEYHCHPNNRLDDDFKKRRAILESGNYFVWNITWSDLEEKKNSKAFICRQDLAELLHRYSIDANSRGKQMPEAIMALGSGMDQLIAFLEKPSPTGWELLSTMAAFIPLQTLLSKQLTNGTDFVSIIDKWKTGERINDGDFCKDGDVVVHYELGFEDDILCFIKQIDAMNNRYSESIILARLHNDEAHTTSADYPERWRRFLASMNLFQFAKTFQFWTTGQMEGPDIPDVPLASLEMIDSSWKPVLDAAVSQLGAVINDLAQDGHISIPEVEYYDDSLPVDAFAELAWPKAKTRFLLLVGDQMVYEREWRGAGWITITYDDIIGKGVQWFIETVKKYC